MSTSKDTRGSQKELVLLRMHFTRNTSLTRDYIVNTTLFKFKSFVLNIVLTDVQSAILSVQIIRQPKYSDLKYRLHG